VKRLVSARTLLAAGLAVIAVISLVTVVVVQQIALQRSLQAESAASVVTEPAVSTSMGPSISITYYGYTFTEFSNCKPDAGSIFLDLWISIDNQGYDNVPTASTNFGNTYPYYFYLDVGNQQYNGFPLSCQLSNERLPMTNVVNGLTVSGYLAFEIPANFGPYTLIYQPPSGNYNVQYNDEGYTTGIVTTVTT
jgi:hypothetical protein